MTSTNVTQAQPKPSTRKPSTRKPAQGAGTTPPSSPDAAKPTPTPTPAPAPKPEPVDFALVFSGLYAGAAKVQDEVVLVLHAVSGSGGQGPARARGLCALAKAVGAEAGHDASTRRPDATVTVVAHETLAKALDAFFTRIQPDMEEAGKVARAAARKAEQPTYDQLRAQRVALEGFCTDIVKRSAKTIKLDAKRQEAIAQAYAAMFHPEAEAVAEARAEDAKAVETDAKADDAKAEDAK